MLATTARAAFRGRCRLAAGQYCLHTRSGAEANAASYESARSFAIQQSSGAGQGATAAKSHDAAPDEPLRRFLADGDISALFRSQDTTLDVMSGSCGC
eukprot:Skav220282  [mRNA]  locus=scaffold915:85777:87917:+ [translate_table: standard]